MVPSCPPTSLAISSVVAERDSRIDVHRSPRWYHADDIGAAAKRLTQKRWLRIATIGAPGSSSAGAKSRPSIG
ncbi:MAG TPA: hypothetical protein VIY49_00040 [Bryobacteraceae bacterium]